MYVESAKNTWLSYGNLDLTMHLSGISLNFISKNIFTIELLKHNEKYT